MTILKSLMTDVPPISAMPYKKHLNKIEMVAKIAKRVPHPAVQQAAHTADVAVKVVKQIDEVEKRIGVKKRARQAPQPE